jgi:transposase
MRQLARHVRDIGVQVAELDAKLAPLVTGRAPERLAVHGVGIDVAGNVLVAWDNVRRIRSEAAFAALCGVAPVPSIVGKDQAASAQPRGATAPQIARSGGLS